MKRLLFALSFLLPATLTTTAAPIQPDTPATAPIDYAAFLGQHDMRWDQTPHRWEVAPYSGNGNIGFLFYQHPSDPKNAISLHLGRHDYYDHRLPVDGNDHLWIYRGRLPLGRFQITAKGNITASDLRLSLHKAELTGTLTTDQGTIDLRALTHSTHDSVFFQTTAHNEAVTIKWLPEVPYSSSRKTLDAGGGPKSPHWDPIRNAPYPVPPKATFGEKDGIHHCQQILHDHRGETTTTWNIDGKADATENLQGKPSVQTLLASVHHSFPEKNSLPIATANLIKAQTNLAAKTYFPSHYQWWSDYYPQSFLTLDDPEKEAFYWIQMYKLGSAMRENGPILDLMGPWYHYTFWPMVWGDLNVQLQYWTHLTSNRLSVGESLPNNIDKYQDNLLKNTPEKWKDSASISTSFPQDMRGDSKGKTPDMLVWILHNYWLHCQFAADDTRLRDHFSPRLNEKDLPLQNTTLSPDEKTLTLHVNDLKPTWQMSIQYKLKSKNGQAVSGEIQNTIHTLLQGN